MTPPERWSNPAAMRCARFARRPRTRRSRPRARHRDDGAPRRRVRQGRWRRGPPHGSLAREHRVRPRARFRRCLAARRLATAAWDAVIDASNAVELPALALDLVEPGKRVVYLGLAGTPSLIDTRTVALKDVTAVGILAASQGLAGTIEHYAAGLGRPPAARRRHRRARSGRRRAVRMAARDRLGGTEDSRRPASCRTEATRGRARNECDRMPEMNDFDGLVAVVTGGASGIGAATARSLRDRGARVAVLDRAYSAVITQRCSRSRATSPMRTSARAAIDTVAEFARIHRHPDQQRGHRREWRCHRRMTTTNGIAS